MNVSDSKRLWLVKSSINALSIELYIPGYQFCDPERCLKERLARGNQGINPLS